MSVLPLDLGVILLEIGTSELLLLSTSSYRTEVSYSPTEPASYITLS